MASQRSAGPETRHPDPEEGVLPAVVWTRSDGAERFVCYADEADPEEIDEQWLSVDAGYPVSLLLRR